MLLLNHATCLYFRVETEVLENVQLNERETLHRIEIHTLKVTITSTDLYLIILRSTGRPVKHRANESLWTKALIMQPVVQFS